VGRGRASPAATSDPTIHSFHSVSSVDAEHAAFPLSEQAAAPPPAGAPPAASHEPCDESAQADAGAHAGAAAATSAPARGAAAASADLRRLLGSIQGKYRLGAVGHAGVKVR
jgi:hypothetical protein